MRRTERFEKTEGAGFQAAPFRRTGNGNQIDCSIHSLILDLGSAPTLVAATWPWLKIIRVGMPRTPYLVGTCGFSSILILATVTLSPSSAASSSSAGAIMRQGPHHSAQKSTTTGFEEFRTSFWNEASDTFTGAVMAFLGLVSAAANLGTGGPGIKPRTNAADFRVQHGVGERHQARPVGPDERGGDSPPRINLCERGAIERHLRAVKLRHLLDRLGRRTVCLEIHNQDVAVAHGQSV